MAGNVTKPECLCSECTARVSPSNWQFAKAQHLALCPLPFSDHLNQVGNTHVVGSQEGTCSEFTQEKCPTWVMVVTSRPHTVPHRCCWEWFEWQEQAWGQM